MEIVKKAAHIAVRAHKGQVRKTDGSPYIVHPFMVSLKLVRHDFPDSVIAAALLHDVLEDTRVSEEELRSEVGDEVTHIVISLTEDKSLLWEKRKGAYIETVRNGPSEVKAVSVSDKIHNLESLLFAYEKQGPSVWGTFNRGKEKKLWFEEELLKMFKETWQHPLIEEYERLIQEMRKLV